MPDPLKLRLCRLLVFKIQFVQKPHFFESVDDILIYEFHR